MVFLFFDIYIILIEDLNMLLGYGAKNFCCFQDWMEIDMTFSAAIPENISNGLNYATSMCLKGANASGKTNAIKVLSFLSYFATDSFNMKPEDEILFDTFFNNEKPAEFFVKFQADDIEYTYELVVTTKVVEKEIISKKDQRNTIVFERVSDQITRNSLFDTKKEFPIRSNASIISTANQYEVNEIKILYNFFSSIITNVAYSGMKQKNFDYNQFCKYYKNNSEIFSFVKKKISEFDTGINDIEISSYKNQKNDEIYFPIFKHLVTTEIKFLLFEVQSTGTKALFEYLFYYYNVLNNGGLLLMDEFDINLHPDILPHLIRLFNDSKDNSKNAQIIFTTHNTDIIDQMGKYRTYLFNKENGSSYCYRLDELSNNVIRNDRPISPLYKSKKIGGVPRINL